MTMSKSALKKEEQKFKEIKQLHNFKQINLNNKFIRLSSFMLQLKQHAAAIIRHQLMLCILC